MPTDTQKPRGDEIVVRLLTVKLGIGLEKRSSFSTSSSKLLVLTLGA
jgi:hypothetical protein